MKKIRLLSYFPSDRPIRKNFVLWVIRAGLFLISILSLPKDLFSQNIGIGITNPTHAKLELHGSVGATAAIFGGESSGISLQTNWPAIGFNQYYNNGPKYISNGYAAVQFLDPNNGYMVLDIFGPGSANANVTSTQRAFTISNLGNIGIRTGPQNATLYTVKAGNFDGSVVFGGTTYNSHYNYGTDEHTYIRSGRFGSKVFLNDILGNNVVFGSGNSMVGINTGNPTYTLEIRQVNGKGFAIIDPASQFDKWDYRMEYDPGFSPQSSLRISFNGENRGSFRPNGTYSTSSDNRIKTNIKPLDAVLDKINLLQPSIYEMKDHNDNHEKTFGFIAQDVKPLFPGLVSVHQIIVDSVNHIPDLHGLNYTGLSVIAIKALQEQYEQIKALQKENDELMKRLEALEKKIVAKTSINR